MENVLAITSTVANAFNWWKSKFIEKFGDKHSPDAIVPGEAGFAKAGDGVIKKYEHPKKKRVTESPKIYADKHQGGEKGVGEIQPPPLLEITENSDSVQARNDITTSTILIGTLVPLVVISLLLYFFCCFKGVCCTGKSLFGDVGVPKKESKKSSKQGGKLSSKIKNEGFSTDASSSSGKVTTPGSAMKKKSTFATSTGSSAGSVLGAGSSVSATSSAVGGGKSNVSSVVGSSVVGGSSAVGGNSAVGGSSVLGGSSASSAVGSFSAAGSSVVGKEGNSSVVGGGRASNFSAASSVSSGGGGSVKGGKNQSSKTALNSSKVASKKHL